MEPGLWLIEMATGMRYVCNVTHPEMDGKIHFNECAWLATSGVRVSELLSKGVQTATEVEEMTPGYHNAGAVISVWRWPFEMPRSQ